MESVSVDRYVQKGQGSGGNGCHTCEDTQISITIGVFTQFAEKITSSC